MTINRLFGKTPITNVSSFSVSSDGKTAAYKKHGDTEWTTFPLKEVNTITE